MQNQVKGPRTSGEELCFDVTLEGRGAVMTMKGQGRAWRCEPAREGLPSPGSHCVWGATREGQDRLCIFTKASGHLWDRRAWQ